jgi:dTDP-4-amino-4,6-dideoxygalactose transaminase
MSKLAIFNNKKSIKPAPKEMFHWPIVNQAMRDATIKVLDEGTMSGLDITKKFEKEFAAWHEIEFALGHTSGTAALHAAMFAVGVGAGDEIIAPSITYWATCTQALSLGATVRFADVDPETFCIDPKDIEKRITDKTKAIVVVHYLGHPADMDAIMAIAEKYNLKVIEDVSHAHGSLYKGKMVGTIGDVAGFSCMTGKSFAIGEAGMLITHNRTVYERALLFGHYARHDEITTPELQKMTGLPLGGFKYRMHQMSATIGIEQLKKFPTELVEIEKSMKYFWKLLEDIPGIRAHAPKDDSGLTMGAWYAPRGVYDAKAFGGLSVKRFCEAITAEGVEGVSPGCNIPLHNHSLFHSIDVYNEGSPTNGVYPALELPVSTAANSRMFAVPWFKHFDKEFIEQYATAIKKVANAYKELLPGDQATTNTMPSQWGLSRR